MSREEGNARDIEVLQVFRTHAGPDVLIGVDANNGYDLAGGKRLFNEIADLKIAFAEEIFEERVEDCLAFKDHLTSLGLDTLVADGETQSDLNVFKPFIEAGAIEVLQADMNQFGFEGILREAEWARPKNLQVAPHNWGSLVGFYMQLHVGRAISNFYRAEHDPLTNGVLIAEGYAIENGAATLPDAPGMGITINEEEFAKHAKIRFDVKS
jgi:L-alanine-DL-glutamate epimerase-like enolase superfamily enzyme